MAALLIALVFLAMGITFLFWPEKLRDWTLKSHEKNALSKATWMKKMMFMPGYIISFRVAGLLAVGASCLLVWLTFGGHVGS